MDLTTCIIAIKQGAARMAATFTLTRPHVRAEAVYYQFPTPQRVDASRWLALGFVVVDYRGGPKVNVVRECDTPELAAWRAAW